MFGIGTLTVLILFTLMGPAVFLILVSIIGAYVFSFMTSIYNSTLSDSTLSKDLIHIQRAFNTEAILKASPTQQDVVSYYTKTTDRDYRLLELFAGPGLHTRLNARHPIHTHTGNARQVMHVMNEMAYASEGVTKVLEIGSGRGYCTLMLAGLLPSKHFEFDAIDIVPRHIEAARMDAKGYTNVHFHLYDAATFDPPASFNTIFAVESLCHLDTAASMASFFANAADHLAPGGRIIIIDGFRSDNFSKAPPDQQLAMRLAERGFSIKRMHTMGEWVKCAENEELVMLSGEDLTEEALPFWTMGWRFAHAFLGHVPAWVIRRLRASPFTARSTDNLLSVATVAHAMRNKAAAVYGVMVFGRLEDD